MSDQGLQLSYWLVTMRPLLRKVGAVLFIAFDLLLVLLAVSLMIRYAAGADAQERLIASLGDNRVPYASVNGRLTPREPTVSQVAVVAGENGAFTLIAVVANRDQRWAVVSTDYAFVLDDQEVATGTVSFFPGEERFLTNFNVALPRVNPTVTPTVRFSNSRFRRVLAASDLPDIRLTVDRPAYRVLSSQPGSRLSQVAATVTNDSVFRLPSVELTAVLMNGSTVVGAGRLTLTDLEALEERPVDLRLFQNLAVTNVLVHATVDLSTLVSE